MSVETIFAQLRDRASWPPVPERVWLPATEADLRPATEADFLPVTPEHLRRWIIPEDKD